MKKTKFNLFKNNKKSVSLLFLSLVLVFGFLFTTKIIFAQQDNTQDATNTATDQAVKKINDLGNNGNGLIPDCGRTSKTTATGNNFCSPKDAALLVSKLLQVAAYLVIIALVLIVILASVGYVYKGDNVTYIAKYKKYIWDAVIALGVLMLVFTVVFGLLSGVGINSQLLDFLKQTFAYQNFNIFPHAMAQDIPKIASENGKYIDFFGGQTLGSIVLLFFKFLVNYIAAPILTLSVILAGGKFVAAQGNSVELEKAKKFAIRVIIAIAVAAAAEILILTLLNTVESVKKDANVGTSANTNQVVTKSTTGSNQASAATKTGTGSSKNTNNSSKANNSSGDTTANNSSGDTATGEACDLDADCTSGNCSDGKCATSSDTISGNTSNTDNSNTSTNSNTNLNEGDHCNSDSQCKSGICNIDDSGVGMCSEKSATNSSVSFTNPAGGTCVVNSDCDSGKCSLETNICQ